MKEQGEDVEKVKEQIKELRQNKTLKGATTQAQFYQDLVEQNLIENKTEEVTDFLNLPKEIPSLPASVVPTELDAESPEKDVQTEFERCLEVIRTNSETVGKLKSVPKKDAYKGPSFSGRKPDLVNHEKDCSGSIAITFFGDLKKRGAASSGNFSDEEMGHVLDMARTFMERVGHYRQKLVTFLSDGKRWQFFVVKRSKDNEGLCYEASKIVNNTQSGWNIFWALLQQEVSNLGCREPKVSGVQLKDPLGRGSSATVYEGKCEDESVLIKIFDTNKASSFQAEKKALELLQESSSVPHIKRVARVEDSTKFKIHEEALVLTPVAKVLRTDKCRFGERVDGRHMKELVEIVEQAHDCELLHRDIKPDNCFLADDGSFILSDWGSSRMATDATGVWEGSIGYSVTQEQQKEYRWDDKACDLVAVVRTAYVLFCKESPPVDDAAEAIEYWDKEFRDGSGWKEALTNAIKMNYKELARVLLYLK